MTLSYRRIHMKRQEIYGTARVYRCAGPCGCNAADWATLHPKEEHDQGLVLWIDFIPLCRSCHVKYDATPAGRQAAADKNRGQRRTPEQRRHMGEARATVKARLPEMTPELRAARVAAGKKSGETRRRKSGQKS